MVHICKRCRHINPREANYCYHDGVLLGRAGGDFPADGSAVNIGVRPFTVPCVFPSGEACHNIQQLAEACHQAPPAALRLLSQGHLESFLAGQGRTDLAAAARAAAQAPDKERGLDDFLGRLPFRLPPAKLRVETTVFDLGTLGVGTDRRLDLKLRNAGERLVYGSADCDVPWLSLGDGTAQSNKLFQFATAQTLPVHIVGKNLHAFHKPQEGVIQLESSGGAVTVTIRVHVPVEPFPTGALAGAHSPRELAKKAHDAPKEAAALIESGAVSRWYEANGWTYPVRGPAASGVAAVQQLFEALGLVKPPRVELSEDIIRLKGRPGEKLEYSIAVITQEARSVIAHGTSDQAWLQVGKTVFRGRSAFVPLTIAGVSGGSGETLQAVVSIVANGGQHFAVPVRLTVVGAVAAAPVAPRPAASGSPQKGTIQAASNNPTPLAVPIAAPAPATVPRADASNRRRLWPTLLPAVLLLAVASGGVLRDWLTPAHSRTAITPGPAADSAPLLQIRFHDVTQDDVLDTLYLPGHEATMRFGLVMLRGGKEIGAGADLRRLTFDPWGRTNNTCLRFDKKDERLVGSGGSGHWRQSAVKGWKDNLGQEHDGVQSIWTWDDKKIDVTQFVELVRGSQSALLDTCRVRYLIENRDIQKHQIGIRFLLDTFIGSNDGVPFTVPGEPDLCDTMKDLPSQARDKKIPDFLQALEKPDLARPGTIAHVRLRLDNLEPPQRVTLGAWPNEKLRVLSKNARGPLTLWDVPLLPLKSLDLDDSAVTIYWEEKFLDAGAVREVGFEYGLRSLANQGSRLASIVDGAFRPDGELTVVAYVNRSGQNLVEESVTLKIPDGFKLLEGAATQPVPRLLKDAAPVNVPITWRVQAGVNGSYEFTVTSSSGLSQTLKVEIRKSIY